MSQEEDERMARVLRWVRIEAAREIREETGREPSEAEITAKILTDALAPSDDR